MTDTGSPLFRRGIASEFQTPELGTLNSELQRAERLERYTRSNGSNATVASRFAFDPVPVAAAATQRTIG